MRHYELTSKFTQRFLKIIDESARNVFGNIPTSNFRTGAKILKRKPYGPIWNSYYPEDSSRAIRNLNPDFQTELEERRLAALAKAKQVGKGPPKKGQGKRVTKKR